MQPSKEQIAAAAMLVVGHVTQFPMRPPKVFIGDVDGIASCRDWQPWADTEAGRSDALVLLAAVYKRAMAMTSHACLCDSCAPWYVAIIHSLESGNVQQIQQATFDAAVEIGKHTGGSDEVSQAQVRVER